jgi:hypothetical protein
MHPLTLTIVRLIAPAAAVAVFAASAFAHELTLHAAPPLLAVTAAFTTRFAIAFVNGPSYPNERRFPLRPPGVLAIVLVPVAWAAAVWLPVVGVLLLAARAWIIGVPVLAAGIVAVVVLGRSLYGLARRWVVFVPAGLVLHDPMALSDPVLFTREHIVGLGLARAGADDRALDLTMGSFGNALQLDLDEAAQLSLLRGKSAEASSILFAPSTPGAVATYRAMPAPTTASSS